MGIFLDGEVWDEVSIKEVYDQDLDEFIMNLVEARKQGYTRLKVVYYMNGVTDYALLRQSADKEEDLFN